MQPIGYDALEAGFDTRQEWFGRDLTNLRTNDVFNGIIDPNPPIIPESLLGDDPREFGVIHAKKDGTGNCKLGDVVRDADGNQWILLRRDDNPADFVVKFWAHKKVS